LLIDGGIRHGGMIMKENEDCSVDGYVRKLKMATDNGVL